MLEVADLVCGYEKVAVVRGISFSLEANEILAIVGPNGSGKSTTLKSVAGVVKPQAGSVWFNGMDISGLSASRIARNNLVMVPENRGVFRSLTVEENLMVPLTVFSRRMAGPDLLQEIYDIFPRLKERRKLRAESLSGGEQQMLVIGRALLAKPRLMMIDEPSLGLAPKVTAQIYGILADLKDNRGLSVLVVEQSANRVLDVADRVCVIREGRLQLSKRVGDLSGRDELHDAYFGLSGHGTAERSAV